jgi:hypothetical protein
MLIYPCCRLRAVAAIRAVEIEGDDAMLAESAFECGAAIYRCGCVVSHNFIVVPLPVRALGNRCATFLQETVWRHRYSSLLLIYHLSSGSRHTTPARRRTSAACNLSGVQRGGARCRRSIITSASEPAVSGIHASGGCVPGHTDRVQGKVACSQDAS